jgi:hypothetical protein
VWRWRACGSQCWASASLRGAGRSPRRADACRRRATRSRWWARSSRSCGSAPA